MLYHFHEHDKKKGNMPNELSDFDFVSVDIVLVCLKERRWKEEFVFVFISV